MSYLLEHAKRELSLAGLDDPKDAIQSAITENVIELIETFAAQGHSGTTAPYVLAIFEKLARFETISPNDHSLYVDWTAISDGPLWQDLRDSRWFSRDHGKTWYRIDG